MPTFGPEQWRALSPYLDQALEIPAEERGAWLEKIRQNDPGLAANLQTLLEEHRALDAAGFLQGAHAAAAIPPSLVGQTVGAYTLEAPLGQGGMGTVWLARRSDGRFEGRAAVKLLNFALIGQRGEGRFKREGSILALLAHPHIAHLIDAGVTTGGQPYLVLEYVEGQPIDAFCRDRALGIEERIRLFLQVLSAVAHAHANLIVHRDLKPSNVLVARDGQVKLLDFGIAKLIESEASDSAATALTREGGQVLTLAYAAPEQIGGGAVTTATDVYALGVLLYQLLVGKHPAEAVLHSHADLVKAVVEREPTAPSAAVGPNAKLRRALRGDLDTVVAKALKKAPTERYRSVGELADDLRRYLAHQPLSARPDTLVYRAWKFVRRNRTAVALAAVALVAGVAGIVGTLLQARSARQERDFALLQLSRAEAINNLNRFVLSDAAPSGRPFTVNDLLARAEKLVERQQSGDVDRVELLISIGSQYLRQDEDAKAQKVLTEAYDLSRRSSDPSTRARASCELAVAVAPAGDVQRARGLIDEAMRELPDDPRFALDRFSCLLRASEVARDRGLAQEAIEDVEAAQRELKAAPIHSKLMEVSTLMELAESYRTAGRHEDASATFEEAFPRLEALGRDETEQAGTLLNNWGISLVQLGRPLAAEKVLKRALDLSRADDAEQGVSPMLLINYARALRDLGRMDDAARYAELGYAAGKKAGDDVVVNQSLLLRASIDRAQGDLTRATAMLAEAEPRFRLALPAGHIAFAALTSEQSLLARARGEGQPALDLANQALAIAEASLKRGGQGADYLPNLLVRRSEAELPLGHVAEAVADAQRGVDLLRGAIRPGGVTLNLGRAYVALGSALLARGRGDEARHAFRSAVEQLAGAGGADHPEARAARQRL